MGEERLHSGPFGSPQTVEEWWARILSIYLFAGLMAVTFYVSYNFSLMPYLRSKGRIFHLLSAQTDQITATYAGIAAFCMFAFMVYKKLSIYILLGVLVLAVVLAEKLQMGLSIGYIMFGPHVTAAMITVLILPLALPCILYQCGWLRWLD